MQFQKCDVRDTTVARASCILESTLLLLLIERNWNILYLCDLDGKTFVQNFTEIRGMLKNLKADI